MSSSSKKQSTVGRRSTVSQNSTFSKAATPDPGRVELPAITTTTDDGVPLFLFSAKSARERRAQYENRFDELCEVIIVNDRTVHKSSEGVGSSPRFPTLHVAYIARAMGLNLSNHQVLDLVRLVEDDAASTGTVDRQCLCAVIVDALTTGQLGGPTLVEHGIVPAARIITPPSSCVRNDERQIYRAFCALDQRHNGYLEEGELRVALTSIGEPFTEDEMEEMLMAILDPETKLAYYRDFADALARE